MFNLQDTFFYLTLIKIKTISNYMHQTSGSSTKDDISDKGNIFLV